MFYSEIHFWESVVIFCHDFLQRKKKEIEPANHEKAQMQLAEKLVHGWLTEDVRDTGSWLSEQSSVCGSVRMFSLQLQMKLAVKPSPLAVVCRRKLKVR